MTDVHICVRRIALRKVNRRRCPTCARRTRQLCEFEEWYGWTLTCLSCGDAWTDGEMLPRPFAPGWREKSIAAAKTRVRDMRAKET